MSELPQNKDKDPLEKLRLDLFRTREMLDINYGLDELSNIAKSYSKKLDKMIKSLEKDVSKIKEDEKPCC